ncbi:DNA gyrase subunit A [Patescibacteria group bacterium]|nr:DNA gyrase subunit A [Patescibacteria group bacterium]MBU1868538.1 DNA gyrase subunit A [Patescibacteria group bacterium]
MVKKDKSATAIKTISIGNVIETTITEEMKKSYLDYAMSVIVARAIPDVRDGLKPVQRRILYAMHRLGLSYSSVHKKSARIVGETIGKYHPHGDMAVYEAMVRMAQKFSLRYPLIDGQGNFGSIDNDPPAAMRYTEAKLSKIAKGLLEDLDKNTVPFLPNFDASEIEPEIFPALLPNFFLNGADGIAVGMATKIPPHNLGEIVDALSFMIDKLKTIHQPLADTSESAKPPSSSVASSTKLLLNNLLTTEQALQLPSSTTDQLTSCLTEFDIDSDVSVEDLVEFVKGPDFPTGGIIYNQNEIIQAYATGKGRILIRGKTDIRESSQGKFQIIISEIPYQQNKALLVTKIASLVQEKKLTDISDIRDESDRKGLSVVIDLKASANPQKTLNQLYKFTPLQTSYHANMVALVDGKPQLLTLKTALVEYLKHRKEIVIRRSLFDLYQCLYRAHILAGLRIALDNLDEIIEIIKKSKNTETARTNLMNKYKLTYIQAQAILDLQLKKLVALERQKILDELKEKQNLIASLETLLGSPKKILNVIKKELTGIKEAFGDDRRTKVRKGKPGEISEEDLVKSEDVIVILSRAGYIKRVSTISFRTQGRGGKGVKGADLKEEDINQEIILANTLDDMLFFTNKGRVYSTRVFELPATSRTARGQAIVNILPLEGNERVTSILTLTNTSQKS